MQNEKLYLIYRKMRSLGNKILFRLCGVLPIKKNKVVFCSIEGICGYSCNPKYIADELLRQDKRYDIYWLVNHMEKAFPSPIHKVKNTFWNRAYHLSTAKVWIDNSRKPLGTIKRKKQLYIQTWHATLAFKPAGKLRSSFPEIARLVSENDSKMADYILTDSEWCDRLYPDLLFSHGNTLRIGSPRCDILINERQKNKQYARLREKYGLNQQVKIVLFAPTFRGGGQKGVRTVFAEKSSLDLIRLQTILSSKWEGEWCIFLRLHPQLAAMMTWDSMEEKDGIYDVSKVDDMNEILAGADVCITDYSSAAFDASYAGIPVFIYADDMDIFTEDRGELLWKMDDLPFSVANNNEELEQNIKVFHAEKYRQQLLDLFKNVDLLQDGKASQRAGKIIQKYVFGDEV